MKLRALWARLPEGLRREAVSVGKGALLAAAGAAGAYLYHAATSTDFGSWTPVIVAAASVLANAARKSWPALAGPKE